MLTLGDISLPNLSVDYSGYFIEKNKCKTSSLFARDIAEENRRLEHDLKNTRLEFEKCNAEEIEKRKEAENLSALCAVKIEELEVVRNSRKELGGLIKDIEDSKSKEELESLENAKKTLNIYKRLFKLKWLHPSTENVLESVIFNEKNAFLKYVEFSKNDAHLVETVWMEISQACDNTWKNLLPEILPLGPCK